MISAATVSEIACLGGVWVEEDGLDLRTDEIGCLSESVEEEEDDLVSGFRAVPDRVPREAKRCSPQLIFPFISLFVSRGFRAFRGF